MAMGLLNYLTENDPEDWVIESAGVWALENQQAADNTQKLLLEKQIDLNSHRSRPVNLALIKEFNLILVMERNHKEALQSAFPEYRSKIYLLSEMVGRQNEIIDPVGGTLSDYKATEIEIENILLQGFSEIKKLSKEE